MNTALSPEYPDGHTHPGGHKKPCPWCGKEIDMDELLLDDDLRSIVRQAAAFGPYGTAVWAYLELFGAAPLARRRKKLLLLLADMKRLFDTERFTFQKVEYAISRAGIAHALETTARRAFADRLENHNYLKKIMVGVAETEGAAKSKRDETALRDREERMRHRVPERAPTEEEAAENRRRVQALVRGLK